MNLILAKFSACGGTIDKSELDYPGTGSYYPKNVVCEWTITRSFTYVITFLRFDVEYSLNCWFDHLQVDDIGKLCGANIPHAIPVDEKDGTINVTFRSDVFGKGRGFHLKIVKVNGPGNFS